MNREDLEHIIRAAADITDEYEFVIVRSQSILGPIPHPPEVFKMSAEADIYPLNAAHKADAIDAAIGEGSQFHDTFGYYAQGVGPETALLPTGWQSRLQRVQTPGTNDRIGYCLDVLDLFMSKAAAARDKDRVFCIALLQHQFVRLEDGLAAVDLMPIDAATKQTLLARLRRWAKAIDQPPRA